MAPSTSEWPEAHVARPGTFDSLNEATTENRLPYRISSSKRRWQSSLFVSLHNISVLDVIIDSDGDTLVILPYDKEAPDARDDSEEELKE